MVLNSSVVKNNLLPKGWMWMRVGEIAEQINPGFPSGKHNKDSRGVPHLRPMNINKHGEIDLSNTKYVQSDFYDSLQKGDVLFNNTNSPELLGKTAYIKEDTDWAYSNHMTRIRLNNNLLNSAWIAYYLHNLFLSGFFKSNCTHHVNQASINTNFLAERVFIPIPPLPEQHRIVAKIEELFTKLEAGVEALKKVKAELKRYRQAVLKYAFEGKLTAEWREAHKDELEPASVLLERIKEERKKRLGTKYKELPPVDTSDLPELPKGWAWVKLGEAMEPSDEKLNPSEIKDMPYVGLEHIEKDTGKLLGFGRSSSVRSTKTKFRIGDLLYGRLRPYLNKVYVSDFDGICSTDILVFRDKQHISNKYVAYRLLLSDFVN